MDDQQILQLARETILKESRSVAAQAERLDERFVQAARWLLACQGHVLCTGSGTNNPVAARLAHLLSCAGTPALFIHPGDSQHGLSGAVTDRDVLVAISKGGTTAEVNALVEIARKRGARIIGLTEKPDSPLSKLSDLVLTVYPEPQVDPFGMVATGSSLTTCGVADALCVVLLNLRGYTKDQFGETHPGGAVGRRLEQERETQNS